MIASYNGKKVKYCMIIFGEGPETGVVGGFGPRALFLGFWTSSHGPDKDGSFFVLLHRNEWRWLILDIDLQFIKPDVDVIKVLEIMIE